MTWMSGTVLLLQRGRVWQGKAGRGEAVATCATVDWIWNAGIWFFHEAWRTTKEILGSACLAEGMLCGRCEEEGEDAFGSSCTD